MGKLLLFLAAFEAKLYGLLAVALVAVVISIYYYFGWIKAAWFETWRPEGEPAPAAARPVPTPIGAAVLVLLALATVALGLFQQPLTSWLILK
jgi:NADH-quinone oxidoreductase subunit N